MGLFTNTQKRAAKGIYENEVKPFLRDKDGKTYVTMINSFSKFCNETFGCDDKYTTQINEIISKMQDDGYEIVDVKINSIKDQGAFGSMEGFHTLIIYK